MADFAPEDLLAVDHHLPELPAGYGELRVVLLARDPGWLYAYWELTGAARRRLAAEERRLALRLHDVTDLEFDGTRSWWSVLHLVAEDADHAYLPVPEAGRTYLVELGAVGRARAGVAESAFAPLARSGGAPVPPAGPSSQVEDVYAAVPPEGAPAAPGVVPSTPPPGPPAAARNGEVWRGAEAAPGQGAPGKEAHAGGAFAGGAFAGEARVGEARVGEARALTDAPGRVGEAPRPLGPWPAPGLEAWRGEAAPPGWTAEARFAAQAAEVGVASAAASWPQVGAEALPWSWELAGAAPPGAARPGAPGAASMVAPPPWSGEAAAFGPSSGAWDRQTEPGRGAGAGGSEGGDESDGPGGHPA